MTEYGKSFLESAFRAWHRADAERTSYEELLRRHIEMVCATYGLTKDQSYSPAGSALEIAQTQEELYNAERSNVAPHSVPSYRRYDAGKQ